MAKLGAPPRAVDEDRHVGVSRGTYGYPVDYAAKVADIIARDIDRLLQER